MIRIFRRICFFIFRTTCLVETFFWCTINRIPFNKTWRIAGHLHVLRPPFYYKQPQIVIGDYFSCISRFTANSLGTIQPVLIRCESGAILKIGSHTGISGGSIFSCKEVCIGNNVLIGTGTIISDNDSHPFLPEDRDDPQKTAVKPVHISDDVFIGARCIILKGVTIGRGAVIGAGSVVTKDVPSRTLYAGNPAKFIRSF